MVKIYSITYINSFFVIRQGLSSCFLPRFVLHGTESELFSLPWNGSERYSESLIIFLFHRTEFRVVFSSEEGFGTEFLGYASIFVPRNGIPNCFSSAEGLETEFREVSVPQNSRNSVGNKHLFHLFRLFRLPRKYFFVGNSQPYPPPPSQCIYTGT